MKAIYAKLLTVITLALCTGLTWADPPGRVGRLSYVEGGVLFRQSGDAENMTALLNWPITTRNIISTTTNARAEIRVGSAAIRLDSESELEINQLDDQFFVVRLHQGTAAVRIKNRELAQEFAFETPHGRVTLRDPARFRVDVRHAGNQSMVHVFSGDVRFENMDSRFSVSHNKLLEFANGDIRITEMQANLLNDEFDEWNLARDQRDDRSISSRYVSPELTGHEELDIHGKWMMTANYGAVWYPRVVPAGWAPYRDGQWAWVEPWGWTWVDYAPWGYAPSHYGRWVWYNRRWCWVPGAMAARPVWAPALVGWVGGRNWSISVSAGATPAVGWFPLAPREIYVPSYTVSPVYIRQVNITHVTNINQVVYTDAARLAKNQPYRNRVIQNAVTVLPQEQFSANRTVFVRPTKHVSVKPESMRSAPVSPVIPAAIASPAIRETYTQHSSRRGHDGNYHRLQPSVRSSPVNANGETTPTETIARPQMERRGSDDHHRERSLRTESVRNTRQTLPSPHENAGTPPSHEMPARQQREMLEARPVESLPSRNQITIREQREIQKQRELQELSEHRGRREQWEQRERMRDAERLRDRHRLHQHGQLSGTEQQAAPIDHSQRQIQQRPVQPPAQVELRSREHAQRELAAPQLASPPAGMAIPAAVPQAGMHHHSAGPALEMRRAQHESQQANTERRNRSEESRQRTSQEGASGSARIRDHRENRDRPQRPPHMQEHGKERFYR